MIHHFKSEEYEWLNNFYACDIVLDSNTYKSIEHAYMSAKSTNPEWKQFCLTTEDPSIVKRKSREITIREDWNDIRVEVMYKCIQQKFTTDPLMTKLLETGTIYIQEGNWWGDTFWGVDLNIDPPKGRNILGILIMQVRSQLLINDIL